MHIWALILLAIFAILLWKLADDTRGTIKSIAEGILLIVAIILIAGVGGFFLLLLSRTPDTNNAIGMCLVVVLSLLGWWYSCFLDGLRAKEVSDRERDAARQREAQSAQTIQPGEETFDTLLASLLADPRKRSHNDATGAPKSRIASDDLLRRAQEDMRRNGRL